MKTLLIALSVFLFGATAVAPNADAARLGGGRSSGIQRNVTPPAARPVQPAPPARQAQPAPQTPPAAAPASGFGRWLPAIGGLALGGLLGSMFGGGMMGGGAAGALMSGLLIALLAAGVFILVRGAMARRQNGPAMAYSGLGDNGSRAAAPPVFTPAPGVPSNFDSDGFLRAAKMNFIKLQVANDARDLETLRELTTPDMFETFARESRDRGVASQQTDVVSVDADLLALAEEPDQYIASVRFSGMVREALGTPPEEFSEVWHLAKPRQGSGGWLLAGIQQDAPRI